MSTTDKAGQDYWNDSWTRSALPPPAQVHGTELRHHALRAFHEIYRSVLQGLAPGARLLEIGCGQSTWLPYFATEFGLSVSGLDYSPAGCARAKELLTRERVSGEVVCADLFAPPPDWADRFDVVFTNGVIEHFRDTDAVVRAVATYVRPGGKIITSIPNMRGSVGRLQKWLAPEVFDIHVPLSLADLRRSHTRAGLRVTHCRYVLSSNFGVVNVGGRGGWQRLLAAALGRLSMAGWWLERTGVSLPTSQLVSPYLICVAEKPS